MNEYSHTDVMHHPIESHEKAIELIFHVLPHPKQIGNFDTSDHNKLYFDWRGARYSLNLTSGYIHEMLGEGQSTISKTTVLMELLISKHRLVDLMQREEKAKQNT